MKPEYNPFDLSSPTPIGYENKNATTATELMIAEQSNIYYSKVKKHLKVVLDFVERWNKQDKERDVAKSALWLSERLIATPQDNK